MSGVDVAREGAIIRLTLARPEAGNAIDMAMAEALRDAARACAGDSAVRCVILAGSGRLFCAGGDVGAFAGAADPSAFLKTLADTLHDAVAIFATMPKPLVVLVNGPAASAGLSLALLGDIVVAARSAHFTAAYTAIGLTPDGGMTWLLPRMIGLRRAQDMILTNRRITADEGERLGIVTRVVDDEMLDAEGTAIAARLAAGPTAALGASRQLLLDGGLRTLTSHLPFEADAIALAGGGTDGREGIAAFVERRKPHFS